MFTATGVLCLAGHLAQAATIAHRYDFESESAEDSVGMLNGVVEGDPVFTDDAPSGTRSILMDGDGDHVLYGDPMDFGSQFSIALWVKPDPTAMGIQNMLGNGPGGWDSDGFKLYYNTWSDPATADGTLILETGDGADVGEGGNAVRSEPGIISEQVWKHVVATVDVDAATAVFYVDGAVLETTGGVNANMKTESPWELGRMFGSWNLHGALDDVQIYSGVLTADQASYLYSNPGAMVPEPMSAILLTLGVVGLLAMGRRGRQAPVSVA
jgi:hypothetical protein